MVQRRTRALAELVTKTILLLFGICLWKLQFDHADEMDEIDPPSVSPTALTTGATSSAARHWLSDNDVFHIRTNRRRRALLFFYGIVQNRLVERYVSDYRSFQFNYSIGTVIGSIVYRLWYGLLHPLPGDEN